MATEMDSTLTQSGEDSGFSAAADAAVLLVIGEPLSDDHKELILDEITKGKLFYGADYRVDFTNF
jgi:hypothetical protein